MPAITISDETVRTLEDVLEYLSESADNALAMIRSIVARQRDPTLTDAERAEFARRADVWRERRRRDNIACRQIRAILREADSGGGE